MEVNVGFRPAGVFVDQLVDIGLRPNAFGIESSCAGQDFGSPASSAGLLSGRMIRLVATGLPSTFLVT